MNFNETNLIGYLLICLIPSFRYSIMVFAVDNIVDN